MASTENTGISSAIEGATSSSSKSNSAADSYIGSLISLTSKSEIRYEGVLYDINTDTSSIGLKNVRSFGTEGRKKDGPQIAPSDKVYEYILFRGTDIKDLQVKSSPPAQPTIPINNDPAIIQSHYSRPNNSTLGSLPSSTNGSLADFSSQNAQMGLPGSSFQGGIPLYQPGGGLGTWGASPSPPNANGSGLAMPMYWQGYYGPPSSLPHMHQQSLIRPPPGMPMPPPLQHPMQYPNYNVTLPSGASNFSAPNLPPNLLTSNLTTSFSTSSLPASLSEIPSPLLTSTTSPIGLTSVPSAPTNLSSNLPLVPSATVPSETLPALMSNKASNSAFSVANLSISTLSTSPVGTSSTALNAILPSLSSKPNAIPDTDLVKPYQSAVHSSSSVVVPNPLDKETPTPTPSLITPGQLMQSGISTAPSSQSVQIAHKDVEVVQVSSLEPKESSRPVTTEAPPPLLPLPVPSHASQKPYGANFSNHHGRGGYRGRERGRGAGRSRPVTKFTEDFDFIAMNEKFNKDEVWGHLGKSNKSHLKGNEDGNFGDDVSQDDDDELAKPVYNKDDFFDTLSYNALDYESQNGRTRFSEQLKIDTETFGEFARYRGGRGGRGPPRGGRSRGSYYGRGYSHGYGYVGRGRGRSVPRSTA